MTVVADEELAFAGPAALAGHVRAGAVSPRELVELFLGRMLSTGPPLNAFREIFAEEALAAADRLAASEEVRSGSLAGVPFAVKDDMALAGHSVTYGSRSPGLIASEDCAAVARLRAAGAIPVAITNVPELMTMPWTTSIANGITRNPWDLSRTPGGSSGGSGAAVADALVPFATGSDGAGSIRIPAACCGLVGMKPSRGRVSALPRVDPWLGLSVYGALARTVADSALLLEVMQGGEGTTLAPGRFIDAAAAGAAAEDAGSKPLRVAVSAQIPPGILGRVSADQEQALDRTQRLIAELGHQVEERSPRYGMSALTVTQTYFRGVAEDFRELQRPDLTERTTQRMAGFGRRLVADGRRKSLIAKGEKVSAQILELWDSFDVLVTPGLSQTALPAPGRSGAFWPLAFEAAVRFTPFTPLFNLTGQPAVTIPAGFGHDGLPLSVQLVGRVGAEETLYWLAAQIEAARPWAEQRP